MKRLFGILILVLSTAVLSACGGGGGGGGTPAAQTSVKLARTGQTVSYDANTTKADDGALQEGVAWPSPRFTVASSGTGTVVTDNLTGLMWAGDPTLSTLCSSATTTTWQGALDYVACLNTHTYLNYADWRLPNRKELRSLADYSQYNPALPAGHPFTNVQALNYWSSTTSAGGTTSAWDVNMYDGVVLADLKNNFYYVWPVRSGQ